MKIQTLTKVSRNIALTVFGGLLLANQALAQSADQIRWKSTEQVRAILGEPESVTAPVGTHATYVMWKYDTFTVAFANGKAFHLFRKDTLDKLELNENRSSSQG